jgi:hypothetical protein
VEADELDQGPDLWLGAAQQDRAAVGAQPPREHREVDHQRGVREHELGQVYDYVVLGANRAGQSRPPAPLGRSIFIAATAQGRRFFVEVDDPRNLPDTLAGLQGQWTDSRTLVTK